jgi:hypothetical protein
MEYVPMRGCGRKKREGDCGEAARISGAFQDVHPLILCNRLLLVFAFPMVPVGIFIYVLALGVLFLVALAHWFFSFN